MGQIRSKLRGVRPNVAIIETAQLFRNLVSISQDPQQLTEGIPLYDKTLELMQVYRNHYNQTSLQFWIKSIFSRYNFDRLHSEESPIPLQSVWATIRDFTSDKQRRVNTLLLAFAEGFVESENPFQDPELCEERRDTFERAILDFLVKENLIVENGTGDGGEQQR